MEITHIAVMVAWANIVALGADEVVEAVGYHGNAGRQRSHHAIATHRRLDGLQLL